MHHPSDRKRLRKRIIWGSLIVIFLLIIRPVIFLLFVYLDDKPAIPIEKAGYANDASNLNETRILRKVKVEADTSLAIAQIVSLVKKAGNAQKHITIAGATHSMGGHTIYPDGIVLNMRQLNYLKYDSSAQELVAGAGALWADIIPFLDIHRKSVIVMQSNSSFSVGGSISVNCHGWQPDAAPVASTVASFRMIDASGRLLNCSRTENSELFSLVLGGYGLFGVVIDVRLKLTDNKAYTSHQYLIKSRDYVTRFRELVSFHPDIGLAYGRININPDHFMEEAIIATYQPSDTDIPVLKENEFRTLRRTVFRGSVHSNYGKDLRWKMEKWSAKLITKTFSRNQLQNEPVDIYRNTDTNRTDILHEYFIPAGSVARFIETLQKILPGYQADLLNITVRNIKKDQDSYLAYAREEVFGFVMLFSQARNPEAEAEMKRLTQHLVNISVLLGGTYYLPYRLHASKEQMRMAYPRADGFFALKNKYDPNDIFRNLFYEAYR